MDQGQLIRVMDCGPVARTVEHRTATSTQPKLIGCEIIAFRVILTHRRDTITYT